MYSVLKNQEILKSNNQFAEAKFKLKEKFYEATSRIKDRNSINIWVKSYLL